MIWDSLCGNVVLERADRLTDIASWHSHIPFAFWCIEALRPQVFVELGTHKGDSYGAFCQAVAQLSLPTACYAVDTWCGDAQAGAYGEEVFADLRWYHESRYASFSRLVRSTFDEAVSHFSDNAIDLLHIDGLHTYEAVRHDFETWLPKLSRSAVVLFHDINVREGDFGAWRFWDELRSNHPHFTFLHGHGLGVLLVGSDAPEPAKRLVACDPEEATRVRSFFAALGNAIAAEGELRRLQALTDRHAGAEETLATRNVELAETSRALDDARRGLEVTSRALGEKSRALDDATRELGVTSGALAETSRELAALRAEWPVRLAKLVRPAKPRPHRLAHAAHAAVDVLCRAPMRRLGAALRRRRYARLIRRSGLFDAGFYLAQCAEDPAAAKDPIAHYIVCGAAKGFDPSAVFDTSAYLEENPGARRPGKNPLVHFIRSGRKEPRTSHPAHVSTETAVQPHPFRAAASAERRILVVDHRLLTPDRDSGSARMYALVTLLREMGYAVTFVSDGESTGERYEEALLRVGIPVLFGLTAALDHLAAEGHEYEWVLLSRPEQALRYQLGVRAYAPQAKLIFDTVDLHWVRMQREADLTGGDSVRAESERFRRIERVCATTSDVVFTVTPEERDALLAEAPDARVEVIPNVHAGRSTCPPWTGRKDLMFIGGFEHAPNVDAMVWFVDEVMPLIRKELPGVVLHVVGSKMPEEMNRLASPSVHLAGYVPNPDPYFDGSRVFVAPVRFGAGMKGKIGQSMSYGLPVVTTSIGAEGMRLVDGETALLADTAAVFAQAVVRLYSGQRLWTTLSGNGMLHVQRWFAPEVVRERLRAVLSGASGEAPATEPAVGVQRGAS